MVGRGWGSNLAKLDVEGAFQQDCASTYTQIIVVVGHQEPWDIHLMPRGCGDVG